MKRFAAISVVVLLALFCVYESPLAFRIALALERRAAHLQREETSVAGERWVWLEGGQSEAPVVLLHGFGAEKDTWNRFAKALSMHVIAPDLPGFGESDHDWKKSYDVTSQADRLHAFLQARGVTHFHLIGNSMGGWIASYYASQHPEEILSLGLFDSAGVTSPRPSELSAYLARGENPLLVDSPEGLDKLLAFAFYEPPFIPGPLKRQFAEEAVANAAFNKKIFEDFTHQRRVPLEPLLANITAPALVVWGDHDRIIDPSAADVFTHGLPRATKVILKDCGHAPMLEQPEETASQYRAFLEALGPE